MFDLACRHAVHPRPLIRRPAGWVRWSPPSVCCIVILGVVRSGRAAAAPFAVAGYIAAAYWFTSSTSFANPAVTIGRTLTDTFAGIAPVVGAAFIAAQLVGAALAIGLARYLHPDLPAADIVLPQEPYRWPTASRPSCSSASTTPAAPRWPSAGSNTSPKAGPPPSPAAPNPPTQLNPVAVAAMAEVGIDIANHTPRRWADTDLDAADVVVTMGCGDTCPYVPGTRYEDWPLDDPAGQALDTVRLIRDQIRDRVEQLLDGLDLTPSSVEAARSAEVGPTGLWCVCEGIGGGRTTAGDVQSCALDRLSTGERWMPHEVRAVVARAVKRAGRDRRPSRCPTPDRARRWCRCRRAASATPTSTTARAASTTTSRSCSATRRPGSSRRSGPTSPTSRPGDFVDPQLAGRVRHVPVAAGGAGPGTASPPSTPPRR